MGLLNRTRENIRGKNKRDRMDDIFDHGVSRCWTIDGLRKRTLFAFTIRYMCCRMNKWSKCELLMRSVRERCIDCGLISLMDIIEGGGGGLHGVSSMLR